LVIASAFTTSTKKVSIAKDNPVNFLSVSTAKKKNQSKKERLKLADYNSSLKSNTYITLPPITPLYHL